MKVYPEIPEKTMMTILRYFMKTSVPRLIVEEKRKAKEQKKEDSV